MTPEDLVHVARALRVTTASTQPEDSGTAEHAFTTSLVVTPSGQKVIEPPVLGTTADAPALQIQRHTGHEAVANTNMNLTEGGSETGALVRSHTEMPDSSVQFSREIHSRNGRPTCSGCGKDFTRWAALRKHITKGYCKVFAPVSVPVRSTGQQNSELGHRETDPVANRPQIQDLVRNRGFLGIINCRGVLQELKQRCALRHSWIAHTYMMKNHYRNTHPEVFEEHSKNCEKMCHTMGTAQVGDPCVYCDSRVGDRKHLRRCTPLWQRAILCVRHVIGGSVATGGSGILRGRGNAIQSGSQRALETNARPVAQPRLDAGKGGRGKGSKARLRGGTYNNDEDPRIWTMLARALVRHEDSIQALRQDTGLVFWARYDPPSIIPVLQASAKKWQGRAENAQGKLGNMPLREVLFVGILNTLMKALTALDKDPDQIQRCQTSGWLNQERCWVFQKWDRDQRVLVVDDSRTSKLSAQVLQDVQEMLRLAVMGHVINHFHATKKLDMCTSGVLTLIMDLSVRESAGMDLHRLLMEYQGSSVFQLIGLQHRRDSLKRWWSSCRSNWNATKGHDSSQPW